MECLGQMLWESQRSGQPPDGEAYVDCVRRRATADASLDCAPALTASAG